MQSRRGATPTAIDPDDSPTRIGASPERGLVAKADFLILGGEFEEALTDVAHLPRRGRMFRILACTEHCQGNMRRGWCG